MTEKSEKCESLLDDLYDAITAEVAETMRNDAEIILTPYATEKDLGHTFWLIPTDKVSFEDIGERCTITSLVDDELDDVGEDVDRFGTNDERLGILATFATELEECAAKIRTFLAEHVTEETAQ